MFGVGESADHPPFVLNIMPCVHYGCIVLSLLFQLEDQLERTREYEVGNEFLQFIERQPAAEEDLEDYHFEEFDPEFESVVRQ